MVRRKQYHLPLTEVQPAKSDLFGAAKRGVILAANACNCLTGNLPFIYIADIADNLLSQTVRGLRIYP
jgi:hypothetical protein